MDSPENPSPLAISTAYEEIVNRIYSPAQLSEAKLSDLEYANSLEIKTEWIKALWDTGAESSCISDRLARKLGLEGTDYAIMISASSEERVPTYVVNLGFSNGLTFQKLEVAQFRYCGDDSDFIIGMDIINQGDFSITNFSGKTVFSFRIPSLHSIDYEAELLSQKD